MACFKKALRIREARFKDPEGHETIADCHYNIALIYKQTHKTTKALESLGSALRIRQKQVGENSLPVAQVLRILWISFLFFHRFWKLWQKYILEWRIINKLLKDFRVAF